MRMRVVAGTILLGVFLLVCKTTLTHAQSIKFAKLPGAALKSTLPLNNIKFSPVSMANQNNVPYRFSATPVNTCGLPNTFQITYTQGENDHISDFIQSADGSFVLVGQSTGPNAFGSKEAIILRVDAKGNFISNNRISSSKVNSFNRVINTADGGYAAVGNTGSAIYLVKLTSTGAVNWSCWFSNNEPSGSHGIDLVETNDHGLIVVGNYADAFDSSSIVIFKTSQVGSLQWSRKFRSLRKAMATGVAIVEDSVYISGYIAENHTVLSDGILIKLNALTGNHYWTKRYDKAGTEDQVLSVGYSDRSLTLGFCHIDQNYAYEKSITKVDLDGNVLFSKRINTPKNNSIDRFVSPVAGGGYVITYAYANNYIPDAAIARLDAAGKVMFSKEFTKFGWELMCGVRSLNDGTFAMAGDCSPYSNFQTKGELIKTDGNGNTGQCDADTLIITTTDENLSLSPYNWFSVESNVYYYGQFSVPKESKDKLTQNIFCRTLPCEAESISSCQETFQKLYGGSGDDVASDSHTTADNGYVLTGGTTSGTSGTRDGFIMKVLKNGAISWSKTIGGNNDDFLSKVTETKDGFTAIGTTRSFGNTKGETFLIHTDAAGNLIWSKRYSAGTAGGEKGKSVIQLADGGYAFVVNLNDSTADGDAVIARMDAEGNIIWSKRFDNGNDDGFTTLVEDGNILVIGGYATFLNRDAVLMKLYVDDGSMISSRSFYNRAEDDDQMFQVEKISDGLAYSFLSHHMNYQYHINQISCFKERRDEGIFYQRRSEASEEYKLQTAMSVTTPDGSFVYVDCDTTQRGFGEMIKIGPTGIIEWGRDYPEGQFLTTVDRIGNLGLLSAGYEQSFRTSNTRKIMLTATDFIGRSGECGPDLGFNSVDTGHYSVTAFTWKKITDNALTAGAAISPLFINSNFATNTICSATICDTLPPISDSCLTGTIIKYDSHYTHLLADVIKGTDGNYYMAGKNFYGRSTEPLIVKTKPTGEVIWAKTYNQDIRVASFVKIVGTTDNKILAAGENSFQIDHYVTDSVLLMKIDYDGTVIWAKNFSRGGYNANINDIVPSDNGGFFMFITENWGSGSTSTVVTKIDKDGNIIWQKEVQSYASAPVFRSATFDGKSLFLAGDNYSGQGFLTITKLDAASGNHAWSKAIYFNYPLTVTIKSIETIADTVFVFYILTTPTGTFTKDNNLMMLKLSAATGSILANLKLEKPVFSDLFLFNSTYQFHQPHELTKTTDNNFIFTNQADNGGNLSLNMICFSGNGEVKWLRDYPNLTNTGAYKIVQSQNDLLLLTLEKNAPIDYNESYYSGGFIKSDLEGNIKMVADPDNLGYSKLLPKPAFNAFPYEEEPSRVTGVVDAVDLKSSSYTPFVRDIYFKAQQQIHENSSCNFLSISGADSICNAADTVTYTITRNTGCNAPAFWETDSTFLKIIGKTDTSLSVVFLKEGYTNIVAKINSGCNVISRSIRVVSRISPAALMLGPDKTICKGASLILHAGNGFKSYEWQDASTDSTFEVHASGLYYVKATNFCDAVMKDSIVISAAVSLPLFVGNDTTICKNDSLLLTASPGFVSYKWLPFYKMNIQTGQSIVVSPDNEMTYTVTAVQANGCSVKDSIKISLHTLPSLSLGNDTSICKGTSLLLNAGPGFEKYYWNTGASTHQIAVSEAGNYRVTAIDLNGCKAKDSLQIISVFPLPVIHLGNDTSLCVGEKLYLDAGSGFRSYVWNSGDVTQKIMAEEAGKYIVKVIDQNQCTASDSISIISVMPAIRINLGTDTTICKGEKIMLDAGTGYTNYEWSTGQTSQKIYVMNEGNYFVAARNPNGCISRDSFSLLKVNALPIINLDKNPFLCTGDSRVLNAGAANSYLWQDGSTNSTFKAVTKGIYWVRVTNDAGCLATDTTEIKSILPLPQNFLVSDTTLCNSMNLALVPAKKFVSYLWSTGSTSSSIEISSSGSYWLQVIDENGCTGKEYINVIPKNCVTALYFPNAFTPNGDNRNDVFKATLFGSLVNFHLVIYNIFGEKVFETYDVNMGWDGSFKNAKQNLGVFVWYSEYQLKNDTKKVQKGTVTLLR